MHHLAHLGFQLHRPHPALADYVQTYWSISVPSSTPSSKAEFLHPEGGSGVIFNFADKVSFNGKQVHPPCIIAGPSRRTSELVLGPRVDMLGIRFRPGSGACFFSMPLFELQDSHGAPEALDLGYLGNDCYERLAGLNSTQQRISVLDELLITQLRKSNDVYLPIAQLLNQIAQSQGRMPVKQLVDSMDLSWRKLDRQFKFAVGLTPKEFSRLCQVGHARKRLKSAAVDETLTDIGYAAGFYDQAHFIREFRRVIGLTPGQYRRIASARRAK